MRATIDDVARAAGVSVATVSRALRGKDHVAETTRRRVLDSARELGYAPHFGASLLAGGATRTIGLVAPHFDIWYTSQVVSGLVEGLSDVGHDLAVYTVDSPDNRRRFLERAISLQTRMDGLVMVDFFPNDAELELLRRSGLPLVSLGEALDGITSIYVDNFGSARRATEHLLSLGHRRIALGGADEIEAAGSPVLIARRSGYGAALRDAGLEIEASLELPGRLDIEGGRQSIHHLHTLREPPTAAFYLSDEMALGAFAEAGELGISVPGDLSVIGYDDHDMAEAFGLTTMQQRVRWLGTRAANAMLRLTKGDIEPVHDEVTAELIVRSTTAGPH